MNQAFAPPLTRSAAAVRWSGWFLAAMVWASGAVFGLYILLFFGGNALHGALERWNGSVAALYRPQLPAATAGIGAHFAAGGLLLILGPVQLLAAVRERWPWLHRWVGRLYVASAVLAGAGGLAFILAGGTVGGPAMSVGFGLYGALMIVAAANTYRFARARKVERHRAWAIRLFALVVGSWLYRMEYGLWFMTVGHAGHTHNFRGGFDLVMDVFFFLPNLAVAELFIRSRRRDGRHGSVADWATAAMLSAASAFVVLATWFFTVRFWGPGMVSGLTGAALPG